MSKSKSTVPSMVSCSFVYHSHRHSHMHSHRHSIAIGIVKDIDSVSGQCALKTFSMH